MVAGDFDCLIKIRLADRQFLGERLTTLGVAQTHTYIVRKR